MKLGFSVIAQVPDTNEAFPLLGRPQDSLNSHEKDYVARKKGYTCTMTVASKLTSAQI